MLLKKALVNLAMIQAVLVGTSASVAFHLPVDNVFMAFAVLWITSSAISIIPSIAVSLLFAYFRET